MAQAPAVARLVTAKQEFLELKAQETLLAAVLSASNNQGDWCFRAASVADVRGAASHARDDHEAQVRDCQDHVLHIERHSDAIGEGGFVPAGGSHLLRFAHCMWLSGVVEVEALAREYRKLCSAVASLQTGEAAGEAGTRDDSQRDIVQSRLANQVHTTGRYKATVAPLTVTLCVCAQIASMQALTQCIADQEVRNTVHEAQKNECSR